MSAPPLAFANSTAQTIIDLGLASDHMSRIVPTLVWDSAGKRQAFRARIATCSAGGVKMIANSATQSRIQIEESQGWHLVFPYIGCLSVHSDGSLFQLRSGTSALFLPNMRRSAERQTNSMIVANIDIERLINTIAEISGKPAADVSIHERPFDINFNKAPSLFQYFVQISRIVDAASGHENLAICLGAEDMIYRWLTLALDHSNGQGTSASSQRAASSKIDLACDLMRDSTDRALTLTEIEIATGLSSRALQYAFRARFGVSPMEWQRRERMVMAQIRLMQAAPSETITAVAHSMGFSSSSAFATLYKRHFGEMPSETLRRHQKV